MPGGRVNPFAAEKAVNTTGGLCRCIWMPTQDAVYQNLSCCGKKEGIPVLDDSGRVLPEVVRVMEICAEAGIIFATGHSSPEECITLARKAREVGVGKFVVTHANSGIWTMTHEQIKRCIDLGAWIEYSYLTNLWGPGTGEPGAADDPVTGNTLIVYYSFTNNVHTIVSDLQTQIDADVLRVEPAEEGIDYAANNYAVGSALISAIRNNPDDASSYPDIRTTADNLDEYDIIIVAAPLWWSNMAAPMQTFLFRYGDRMAGKHIGLVVSSASSGISGVEADAERLIPEGNFMEPSLWIRSSQTAACHSMLADWLEDINYVSPAAN